MRVFAYEFVTGGGLIDQDLPTSLTREADMMVRTLVAELAGLPGVALLTSRDPRLPAPVGNEVFVPAFGEEPFALFARGLAATDAAWPTAPETGGLLERLARATLDHGKILLGSRPEAVRLTASKQATFDLLNAKGVPVVATYSRPEVVPSRAGPWVVKPDDGAGSDDVRRVPDAATAQAQLKAQSGLVAQPWVDGDVRSLSLICADGESLLLSVNQQRMRCINGRLSLVGIVVNVVRDRSGELGELSDGIAAAIPGLWGYVGVDFIETPDGPVVLEINPRLTTSYCGLRAALGINVAAILLNLRSSGLPHPREIQGPGKPVEIMMETASA